jgi:hypothetical protein
MDPSQLAPFSDVASATAAVRLYAESLVTQGMQAQAQIPDYPQTDSFSPPQPPSQRQRDEHGRFVASAPKVDALDIKALGLDDDEPAAKAIRALEKNMQSLYQEVTSTRDEFSNLTKRQQEQQKAALEAEAESSIDSYKSPVYGVSKSRNVAQMQAAQQLKNLVNAITIQDFTSGSMRPLAKRFELARQIMGVQQAPAQPAAPAPVPPAQAASSQGYKPTATKNMWTSKWSDDPEIRALIGAN